MRSTDIYVMEREREPLSVLSRGEKYRGASNRSATPLASNDFLLQAPRAGRMIPKLGVAFVSKIRR
jgi:hypothetical protein